MSLIDGPRDRLATLAAATDRALELMHQGMTAELASRHVALEAMEQRANAILATLNRTSSAHSVARLILGEQ